MLKQTKVKTSGHAQVTQHSSNQMISIKSGLKSCKNTSIWWEQYHADHTNTITHNRAEFPELNHTIQTIGFHANSWSYFLMLIKIITP